MSFIKRNYWTLVCVFAGFTLQAILTSLGFPIRGASAVALGLAVVFLGTILDRK